MSLLKDWDRRVRLTLLNVVIKPLLWSTFSQADKIETFFAEDEESRFLMRASLRDSIYATSIFSVTNFRVVSPRLSVLLFFFLATTTENLSWSYLSVVL